MIGWPELSAGGCLKKTGAGRAEGLPSPCFAGYLVSADCMVIIAMAEDWFGIRGGSWGQRSRVHDGRAGFEEQLRKRRIANYVSFFKRCVVWKLRAGVVKKYVDRF